jgi:hypothetical protein
MTGARAGLVKRTSAARCSQARRPGRADAQQLAEIEVRDNGKLIAEMPGS